MTLSAEDATSPGDEGERVSRALKVTCFIVASEYGGVSVERSPYRATEEIACGRRHASAGQASPSRPLDALPGYGVTFKTPDAPS